MIAPDAKGGDFGWYKWLPRPFAGVETMMRYVEAHFDIPDAPGIIFPGETSVLLSQEVNIGALLVRRGGGIERQFDTARAGSDASVAMRRRTQRYFQGFRAKRD